MQYSDFYRASKPSRKVLFGMWGSMFSIGLLLVGCGEKEQEQVAEKVVEAADPRLNDTGITWGGNYPADINEDCSAKIITENLPEGEVVQGDILSGQDCAVGADKTQANNVDGVAGFKYTKISSRGEALPAEASQWQCVTDEVSGLMWEVKTPSDKQHGNMGFHDADDLFMWYWGDSSVNGGAVGNWNSEFNQCTGYVKGQPVTYCNLSEFTSRVNTIGLCGAKDWRVPTRHELESLVHYGTTRPAIDVNYFPNTVNDYYWSLSPSAAGKDTAWAVSFQFGFAAPLRRDNPRAVRLVRSVK